MMKMSGKRESPRWMGMGFKPMLKTWRGGYDMQRRVVAKGEALVWCRNCLVYARRSVGRSCAGWKTRAHKSIEQSNWKERCQTAELRNDGGFMAQEEL